MFSDYSLSVAKCQLFVSVQRVSRHLSTLAWPTTTPYHNSTIFSFCDEKSSYRIRAGVASCFTRLMGLMTPGSDQRAAERAQQDAAVPIRHAYASNAASGRPVAMGSDLVKLVSGTEDPANILALRFDKSTLQLIFIYSLFLMSLCYCTLL